MNDYIQYGALGLLAMVIVGLLPIARALAKAHLRNLERLIETQDAILNRVDTAERAIREEVTDTRHAVRDFLTATNAKVDTVTAEVRRLRLAKTPGE